MSRYMPPLTQRFALSLAAGLFLLGLPEQVWAQKQTTVKDEPMHLEVRCEIAAGSFSALCKNIQDDAYYSYPIPAGRRYVIEYIVIGGRVQEI